MGRETLRTVDKAINHWSSDIGPRSRAHWALDEITTESWNLLFSTPYNRYIRPCICPLTSSSDIIVDLLCFNSKERACTCIECLSWRYWKNLWFWISYSSVIWEKGFKLSFRNKCVKYLTPCFCHKSNPSSFLSCSQFALFQIGV